MAQVDPAAGPQPTYIRQNPKIPLAALAFPQWWRLRRQETKQQPIGKTIAFLEYVLIYKTQCLSERSDP